MNDPYAFTNSNEMGEVVEQPRTWSRYAMLDEDGKVFPIGPPTIPLDVWRYVIDPTTKQPVGNIKRERMRTLGEVAEDLYRKLDVIVCEKCGFERARTPEDCCTIHEGCGGECYSFIDEYFDGPSLEREKQELVPHNWRWVACYAVTGNSEGHFVHCDFIVDRADGRQIVRLAVGKTFRGMDHAAEMAKRCAIFLGA